MRKAFGGAQEGAGHGSNADVRIPERVEWQIRSNSLDARDLVVLAADPPPRRSIHRLLDHASDSVQRVRHSGCRTVWRLRREARAPVWRVRFRKTRPAATISIVAHAEAMKRPLRRHPRAAPRPAKLLLIPPVAMHLAARPFFRAAIDSLTQTGLPIRGPATAPAPRREAKLLSIPPVARHLAGRPFVSRGH